MSILPKRFTDRAAAALCLSAVVAVAGCQWITERGITERGITEKGLTERGLHELTAAPDDPTAHQRFVEALKSPVAEVRLEALRAWSTGRLGSLPPEATELRHDGNRHVRIAALEAATRCRHAHAHQYLNAALRDHDNLVRTAAIGLFGELGTAEARATLEQFRQDRSEQVRAEAVSALAELGAKQAVLVAADDKSWRVRLEVARALRQFPDRDGAAIASQLLDDASSPVQSEVIAALAEWPLDRSGPLLLSAMEKSSYLARKTAAEQLAAKWPPAAEFSANSAPGRRTEVLDQLRGRFRRRFSLIDQAAMAQVSHEHPLERTTTQELARVDRLVQQDDVQGLINSGPSVLVALERLVCERHRVPSEAIYREVLPRFQPVFVVLDRLNSSDVSARRRAAQELADLAAVKPLGRLALTRLGQLVTAEADQLVWRSVLIAIAGEAAEPANRLAYAAIGHPSPEVRRRACEHLAAHADPRHAKVLTASLQDSNHSVICAAVRALGAAGRIDDLEPLRRLQRSTNEQIRVETALALVQLGDAGGRVALERLAHGRDPKLRRQVAITMGELGDPAFVATLIDMLDDRLTVSRAALASLPKVVGRDVSGDGSFSSPSTSEKMRRWKQWYERQSTLRPGAAELQPTEGSR